MLVRLWAMAWLARYLKYVPVLGWRFSERIVTGIEERMDRDVDVGDVTVEIDDDSDPPDVRVDVTIANELPVDLTVAAVNLRLGYDDAGYTVANVLWAADAHGRPPANVSRALVRSDSVGALLVERALPATPTSDTLYVDGTLTVRAWLDVPATKRIPLGTLERDFPDAQAPIPS